MTDLVEGYEALASLLPTIRVDPANSEDMFWQINRPRRSKVITRKINRLSKWSVIQSRTMTVQISGEASVTASSAPVNRPLPRHYLQNY